MSGWIGLLITEVTLGEFIWMYKMNFEHSEFELFIKHPNGNVMCAVGMLIERSQLESHQHIGSILSNGTKGDYPDIRIQNQSLRKSSN